MRKSQFLPTGALGLIVAGTLAAAGSAGAVTLADLSDPGFRTFDGTYAPDGNCSRMPQVSITAAGITFRSVGGSQRTTSIEHALSFFGPDYQGISIALFPFPSGADNPGHILMYVNADEVPGRLTLEQNLGPGERLSPFEAEVTAASPLQLCVKD